MPSKCDKRTKDDVGYTLSYITKSIKALRYDLLPIGQVSRKHIRAILDNCINIKPRWTPNMFNNYRKYLSMLFRELLELEAVEQNPVMFISKQKTIKRIKVTMTEEERKIVNEYWKENFPNFHRYLHIFYHSGRRTSELFRMKVKDVNLSNQTFIILEKKGKRFIERLCPITNTALPFWMDLLKDAKPNQFIFCDDFCPGDKPMTPEHVTKHWKRHVKEKLKIDADFYSIKHSNADDIAKNYGIGIAQSFIGHSSAAMTRLYATGQGARDLEVMKSLGNEFV